MRGVWVWEGDINIYLITQDNPARGLNFQRGWKILRATGIYLNFAYDTTYEYPKLTTLTLTGIYVRTYVYEYFLFLDTSRTAYSSSMIACGTHAVATREMVGHLAEDKDERATKRYDKVGPVGRIYESYVLVRIPFCIYDMMLFPLGCLIRELVANCFVVFCLTIN